MVPSSFGKVIGIDLIADMLRRTKEDPGKIALVNVSFHKKPVLQARPKVLILGVCIGVFISCQERNLDTEGSA